MVWDQYIGPYVRFIEVTYLASVYKIRTFKSCKVVYATPKVRAHSRQQRSGQNLLRCRIDVKTRTVETRRSKNALAKLLSETREHLINDALWDQMSILGSGVTGSSRNFLVIPRLVQSLRFISIFRDV